MDLVPRAEDYFKIQWLEPPPECTGICQFTNPSCISKDPSMMRYAEETSLDEVREASQKGCQKCKIIYLCHPDFDVEEDELSLGCSPGSAGLVRGTRYFGKGRNARFFHLGETQLFFPVGTPPPSWSYIKPGRISAAPCCEEYSSILSSWIAECASTHTKCASGPTRLPSRVLDVASEDHIFLHISSGESAPFTALSHCWGRSRHMTTTTFNVDSHRQGIRFTSFPKTFQDAISVTRTLGIRYLWIDSLCILQDDKADWEVESSQMADIYGSAHVVIAASQASNSSEGFLDRSGESVYLQAKNAVQMGEITNPDGSVSTLYRRRMGGRGYYCDSRHHSKLEEEPLTKRGWVLQENILARRIIHFTKDELLWECMECLKCECMEVDNSTINTKSTGMVREMQYVTFSDINMVADKHELWLHLLSKYSSLGLTKESDRLPALSGLAKTWQARGASQYLAGLWEDNLLESICWTAAQNIETRRGSQYRAPSWSPFSLDFSHPSDLSETAHPGFYFLSSRTSKLETPCTKVLDVRCIPTGKDETGSLMGGYLTLHGPVGRVFSIVIDSGHIDLGGYTVGVEWDIPLDTNKTHDLTWVLLGRTSDRTPVALILSLSQTVGDAYERVGLFSHLFEHDLDRLLQGNNEETIRIV
ncbi:hypothetical protein NM208_g640 [Fusarium decemcellulare]|uniref:Uncharacterized protein n=1 Tax=Fusarium decemcellulare TaxID=57161 RepID=A0ACC1SYZ6_9HYPO|nr:hypothetical protein NM208_g640 [Fusarium decemcellulare]